MGGIFSKPSSPTPPPPPPNVDLEGARASEEERKKRRRASGRASTILTGPLGSTPGATPSGAGTRTLVG